VSKEAAWNAINTGSVEAAEVSSQGQSLAKLTDALNEAQQRFAHVKSIFGTTHPEYRKAASDLAEVQKEFDDTRRSIADRIAVEYRESQNKEQMLKKALADTKAEWDSLNTRSFEYQQLKQEADADRALYNELIKKIREADINAGFRNNNIRIADVARPSLHAVFPNMAVNLLLALIFSSLLAVGAALLLDKLDTTLRNPEETSRFLRTDVIGSLPLDQGAVVLPKSSKPELAETSLVPQDASGDNKDGRPRYYRAISGFEEAIRTLRNTILLSVDHSYQRRTRRGENNTVRAPCSSHCSAWQEDAACGWGSSATKRACKVWIDPAAWAIQCVNRRSDLEGSVAFG
jgi:hypothetical protein